MPEHMNDLHRKLVMYEGHAFHNQVLELAEKIQVEVDRLGRPIDLPKRVIHGDLKFNNFLFEGREEGDPPKAHALIDLDTLAKLPLYFDLGDAWRSWCNRSSDGEMEAALDLERFR